ncbi:MAG: PSD1 domain-containing protein [Planctomycetaceae bacterium]|nr:PSD1 domain-containing protein [Planctomycetaceae bacterium]
MTFHKHLLLTIIILAALPSGRGRAETPADSAEFFETRIRPVLVKSCIKCHGEMKASQGLRVDTRDALLGGGDSGPAIVPGDAAASLLLRAIDREHDDVQMPPDQPLPQDVVADFEQWIAAGAAWPAAIDLRNEAAHWAFQPVGDVEIPPPVENGSGHPIDRLIAAQWSRHDLRPVGPAENEAFIRRLSFDLIGLPPSTEETAAFLQAAADDRDAAIVDLIERLLASPQYGERWGRHWMDVVRYADTAGDNADYPIPEVRLYRDYIIDAFNADLPYDQFVYEQLAGDILARHPEDQRAAARGGDGRGAEQVIATGFLALSRRYATAPYELWHLTLEDTIDTVGRAFLGLTMKCARCHDHKFDPVTTEDYYALYGIFESTQFPWAGGEEFQSMKRPRQHFVSLLPEEQIGPLREAFEARLKALRDEIASLEEKVKSCDDSEKEALEKEVARLRSEEVVILRPGLPDGVPGAYAVQEGAPHDARVQYSGEPAQPGDVVSRGAIAFLSPESLEIPEGQSGRLQLAEWITRPDHPLTARVMVNRIWQGHFGRGIVDTPSNFGISGSDPTHPELLDFLASEFVRSGWSIKHMHRLILTSRTWQLASDDDPHSAAIDPGNSFYWKHDRRRLDAEAIRDAMLAVSGTLNLDRPEEHPFPPMKDWKWTQHSQFKDCYDTPHRSVYLMTQRIQRHPFLALFDGPDTNSTTEKRTSSTVTPQALYLMNSPEMAQIAGAFAQRLVANSEEPSERIAAAYQLCFTRAATVDEMQRGSAYVDRLLDALEAEEMSEADRERNAWAIYARVLLSSNEFFYVD